MVIHLHRWRRAEDLFKKQVPRWLYCRYNATKHVITFYDGSNLFFGHVKTDADLLQYQGAEFVPVEPIIFPSSRSR